MSLRDLLLSRGHRGENIEDDPTPVGQDAFSEVARHYDELMATVPYDRWVDYVEQILQRWYVRPRDVLDLCCGTGAVGKELARRGFNVVGADLSEPMVRGCGETAPTLPAAVMDATRSALRPESFDLIVCLYDSFNYIVEPGGLQAAVAGMAEALRPGGVAIFDMNTPRALRIGLFTQNNMTTNEPLQYTWTSTWDERRKLCKVDMQFIWLGDGQPQPFRETHYERAYEIDEVREMIAQAGLRTLAVYEAYSFNSPTAKSHRVYFLTCKDKPK